MIKIFQNIIEAGRTLEIKDPRYPCKIENKGEKFIRVKITSWSGKAPPTLKEKTNIVFEEGDILKIDAGNSVRDKRSPIYKFIKKYFSKPATEIMRLKEIQLNKRQSR